MTVLCFAIWCKMQHSNSVMFGMGTRQLMSSLHIGQPKAQLLLNAIKTDELFSMQDDGRFTVASFKDNTRKLNRYGRAYKGANMFTLEVNKEYTIKDIYNRLNELLFLRQIGSEEANSSHVSGRNTDKTRSCRSKFITIKQFQEGVGMSHGSVSGIKKRLKNKKKSRQHIRNSTWQTGEFRIRLKRCWLDSEERTQRLRRVILCTLQFHVRMPSQT